MSLNTSKREIKDMSAPISGAGNIFGSSTGESSDIFALGGGGSSDPFGGGGGREYAFNNGGEEKSVEDELFGGEDRKSCFSTPKRLTRQYANPPSLKKKSILDDKKEYTLESPEGKEILNNPGEVKEVDGKTIVFNRNIDQFDFGSFFAEAYIVLPNTNPLTNTVKAMYNNLMKQRKTSRETEKFLNQKINAVKKHGLEALIKQEYVLKKKQARKDYANKRRRITANLNDEFKKATGYSTFDGELFK